MRSPVMCSKIRRISSRARKAVVNMVVAPNSLAPVPMATRCEAMRFSSIKSTRISLARVGIWSVIPKAFSTARTQATSWKNGAT